MALRFGVSAVIVAVLIGITALVTSNKDDNKSASDTTTSSAATTTPDDGCACRPSRGLRRHRPAHGPEPADVQSRAADDDRPGQDLHRDDRDELRRRHGRARREGAPKSVNNFVFLAKQGFYDGLKWHRVATDFVIQGGSPTGDQAGGPGYSVKTEVPAQAGYAAGAVGVGQRRQRAGGHRRLAVLRRDRRAVDRRCRADYGMIGTVTAGLEIAQKIASLAPDGGTGDGPPTIPMYMVKVEITES